MEAQTAQVENIAFNSDVEKFSDHLSWYIKLDDFI